MPASTVTGARPGSLSPAATGDDTSRRSRVRSSVDADLAVLERLYGPGRRRWWARFGLVVLAGVALGLSFEPYGLWPLTLVALPTLTLVVRGLRPRAAFGHGYAFALAAFVVSLGWIRVLGVPVAGALIGFMALYVALLALGLRVVSRSRWWPLWSAALWVSCEFVFSRVPFGGFGWGRLAFTGVDAPVAGWFPLIGVAGVSFLVALLAHLLAWTVLRVRRLVPAHRGGGSVPSRRPVVLVVATAAAVLGIGAVGGVVDPVIGAAQQGSVVVGVVQGNVPGRGIDAMGRMRSVTNNHLAETIHLAAEARLGRAATPDLLLWPENSTDIDPTVDPVTEATIELAAQVAGVPILVGAVTYGPGVDQRQTTALWWDPVDGPTATYHKRNLVPFGEWIPFRDQLLPLIPMLELVGAQGVPGTEPGALPVRLADGRPLVVGDVICFELAYDGTVNDVITGGAQIFVVQSNNATYGGTGQIEQQFAITRARAMETRREIAVATTNSVSGAINRRGAVQLRTDEFTSASASVTMPMRTGTTPAVLIGAWVDRGLALVGLLAWIVVGVAGVRARRSAVAPTAGAIGDNGGAAAPAATGAPAAGGGAPTTKETDT